MSFQKHSISYDQTGYFSSIVSDYLNGDEKLRCFYEYFPSETSVEAAILRKKELENRNRAHLAEALLTQYASLEAADKVQENIQLLLDANTFTITTAHQPNIFTGPLYFIYKILHVIKLAEYCNHKYSQYKFVPVYYMGSEDADLDELGHIYLNNEKLAWQTSQSGAVGRMIVDEQLLHLVQRIEAEIGVLPHGQEIMDAVKKYYQKGTSIQQATLGFVHHLFGRYGLIVVIPDNAQLKAAAIDIFKDELLHQRSSEIVEKTIQQLSEAGYKVQAHGRDINLFYLMDNGARLRIEKHNDKWHVLDTDISFTEASLMQELEKHPERFSPNVILRGLFQEMILPNIIFVGGGGELAYWLELKAIFQHYGVAYPILILRNSFLIVNGKYAQQREKLQFTIQDLFKNAQQLQNEWVLRNSAKKLSVDDSIAAIATLFEKLSHQVVTVDTTLKAHIEALHKQSEKKIIEVGKKILRAEKRNQANAMQQIAQLKQALFPNNNLQERIDNILPYYAVWGADFIDTLYQYSNPFEQAFVVLEEA